MNLNRRNFLFGSAAAAALAGCTTTKKGVRALKDGEKPTVAIIGYGLRARDLMREFLGLTDMCRVTAVCDCDKVRLAAGVKRVNDFYAEQKIANVCTAYADFRDVIKNPDIDMVCIDCKGRPQQVPALCIETEEQQREYEAAQKRKQLRKQRRTEGF